jgi:hypothetical protein
MNKEFIRKIKKPLVGIAKEGLDYENRASVSGSPFVNVGFLYTCLSSSPEGERVIYAGHSV